MSDCQTCEREGVCDYAHKPCDCVHYRKFVPAPMTYCTWCDGSGWNPYPLRCRDCKGFGYTRTQPPNVQAQGRCAALSRSVPWSVVLAT